MPIPKETTWADEQAKNEEIERQKYHETIKKKDEPMNTPEETIPPTKNYSLIEISLLEIEKELNEIIYQINTLKEELKPFINPDKPTEEENHLLDKKL